MFQFELTSNEINYKLSIAMLKQMNPNPIIGTIDNIRVYSSQYVPEGTAMFIDANGLYVHH